MDGGKPKHVPTRAQLLNIIRLQTNIAQLGHDLGSVMALVVERTLSLVVSDGAVIELAEGDEMVYRAASGIAAPQLGLRLNLGTSLSGLCVTTGQQLICQDTERDPRVDLQACRALGIRSMLVVPLKHRELCVGVLKVIAKDPESFTLRDKAVLELLAEVLGAEIFYAAKYSADDLFYRATHDDMTGLANRSLFLDRLHNAVSRTKRDGSPIGVLMIDMDGLKAINDRYGHRTGDAAIQEFAGRLRLAVRTTDTVARLGGDEFAVIMQPVDEIGAVEEGVKRIKEAVCLPFNYENSQLNIAASIGSAVAPIDGAESETLLEKADHAMYLVKRQRKQERGG